MGFLIYTLAHPETGEIRYVGKTERGLVVRLAEHRSVAKTKKTHIANWIKSLSAEPVMETIEEVDSSDALNEAETHWIRMFRSWGFRLVNHTDGGEGVSGWHHTEATKRHMSLANKGKKNPNIYEAHKKAMLVVRGRKQTDHERLKRAIGKRGRPFVDQFGNRYLIQKETARRLGITQGSISNVLNNKSTNAGGYVFRFEDNLAPTEGS